MPVPRLARLVLCATAGCSLSQPVLDAPGGSYDADAGRVSARGSEACQAWQRASCEFTAERCGLLPAELCRTQNEGVECRDDAQALECASAFADAPCQLPPANCALEDVADARQAIVACEIYFEAQCESNVRCGLFDDEESCLEHPQLSFDCNRALSIGLGYEACLDALERRRCDQSVPICDNVVRAR